MRTPDAFDMDDAHDMGYDPEPAEVTCRRCGQKGLHWRNVTSADGRREKSYLFDDKIRKHVCQPSADDFEVVK